MLAANFTLGGKMSETDKPILRAPTKLLKYSTEQFELSEPAWERMGRQLSEHYNQNELIWYLFSSFIIISDSRMDSFYVIFSEVSRNSFFQVLSYEHRKHRWPSASLYPKWRGTTLELFKLVPFCQTTWPLSSCSLWVSERCRRRWNMPLRKLEGGGTGEEEGMRRLHHECQRRGNGQWLC